MEPLIDAGTRENESQIIIISSYVLVAFPDVCGALVFLVFVVF